MVVSNTAGITTSGPKPRKYSTVITFMPQMFTLLTQVGNLSNKRWNLSSDDMVFSNRSFPNKLELARLKWKCAQITVHKWLSVGPQAPKHGLIYLRNKWIPLLFTINIKLLGEHQCGFTETENRASCSERGVVEENSSVNNDKSLIGIYLHHRSVWDKM